MKSLIFVSFVFIFQSCFLFSQDWLPLEVGNKWQYINYSWSSTPYDPTVYRYSLKYTSILSDTLISGIQYFNGLYGSGTTGNGVWTRYDSLTQQIYVFCDSAAVLHMDFTLPDSTYSGLLSTPYYCGPWIDVGISTSEDSFLNSQVEVKLYQWFEPGLMEIDYSISYLQYFGILKVESNWHVSGGHLGYSSKRLIQCILNGQNFSDNYSPEIIIQPDTTLSDSVLNFTFQVKHKYNHIFPEGSPNTSLNFIDSVLFYSFYLKQDTIFNSAIVAQWITGTENYQLSVPLDMNLLRNNYKLLYKIESIDKGLVPHKSYSPESGYYIAELDTTTDIKEEVSKPNRFYLYQNYPNPFNPNTKISWQSPVGSWQTLKIYDVLGNEVATLVNEYRNAGSYDLEFNASKLSSGVYYYKLRAGDFVDTKKMILLK
jgi:hypothetical protein